MALGNHYQIHFSIHIYLALGSAIWIIYTIDHLLDTQNALATDRRKFHRKHLHKLVFITGIVIILALINIYFLPLVVIKYGALLSALCVGYLMLVYFVRGLWFKEILVAIGYACGVYLAPFALVSSLSLIDFITCVQIILVALINLCVFSYYDREKDYTEGFGSIVASMGVRKTQWLIQALVTISVILSLLVMIQVSHFAVVSSIFLAMSLVLGMIFWLPKYFAENERFRLIGDGVFYLPLLLLL